MDDKQLMPDGTEKPKEKKYPRDDIPIVRWGGRVCMGAILVWCLYFLLPDKATGGAIKMFLMALTAGLLFPFLALFSLFLLLRIRGIHEPAEMRASYDSPMVRHDLKADFPNTLARLHLQWVGDYYAETKAQARNSFRLTAAAAVLSLIVVGVGIGFLYYGKAEVGKVTAAAGVIQGLISAVFFHLHTRTVTKMADYHQKLILTQNVSLALKAADDLQEPERAKMKSAVIRALTKDIRKGFIPDAPAPSRFRAPSNGVPSSVELTAAPPNGQRE